MKNVVRYERKVIYGLMDHFPMKERMDLLEASIYSRGNLAKSLIKRELGYIPFRGMGTFLHSNGHILPN